MAAQKDAIIKVKVQVTFDARITDDAVDAASAELDLEARRYCDEDDMRRALTAALPFLLSAKPDKAG